MFNSQPKAYSAAQTYDRTRAIRIAGGVDLQEELSDLLVSAYRFAYQLTMDRHRAEDLAQEAILRAVQRNMLTTQSSLRLWVFRVIKNLWIDEFRSQRPTASSMDASNEPASNSRTVVEQIVLQERIHQAMCVMEELPDRQRMVLYLVACEQLSMKQISQVLDISTDAVKSNLCAARMSMRRHCGQNTHLNSHAANALEALSDRNDP